MSTIMGVEASAITKHTGQFVISTNPETVCHAVSFLRELTSSHYPHLLTQNGFYFNEYLSLSKQHCYIFLQTCFGTINQGYLIAESPKEKNLVDLFLTNEEFESRAKNTFMNYGTYTLSVERIHALFTDSYIPNLPNNFVDDWLELDETNLHYKLKLEKINSEKFNDIVMPIESLCTILNGICSSQSLYITSILLTVNKPFAMLFVELARLSASKYKELGLDANNYLNIKQFATRILVFYRTIFSTYLLNQQRINLIHKYMQDF